MRVLRCEPISAANCGVCLLPEEGGDLFSLDRQHRLAREFQVQGELRICSLLNTMTVKRSRHLRLSRRSSHWVMLYV
jgi:hypothetical protein